MSVRVLIADDQAMVRAGFRSLLDDEPDIEVAGEAEDGEEAIAEAVRLRPDVTLMDIRMPKVNGLEATRELARRRIATRIVMLTTFDLDEHVYEALRAGASAFLLKDASPEELIEAIYTSRTATDSSIAPSLGA